jgi:hypothetical protein
MKQVLDAKNDIEKQKLENQIQVIIFLNYYYLNILKYNYKI